MSQDIPRNRWGQPMLPPPGGGKPIPHTRVSTLAKTLDDQTGLGKWKQRQTVLGLAARPDLWALACATGAGDRAGMDRLCEDAMTAAGSAAGANLGTALHSLTESLDRGGRPAPPQELAADLAAYARLTGELALEMLAVELFVVADEVQAAGTLDRLVRLPDGRVVVCDLKTGKDAPRYAHAAAIQVACYAHGQRIDPATGARSPLHEGLDRSVGLLIHLPAGQGRAAAHWLDLDQAWAWAQMAVELREWRKAKPARLAYATAASSPGGGSPPATQEKKEKRQ